MRQTPEKLSYEELTHRQKKRKDILLKEQTIERTNSWKDKLLKGQTLGRTNSWKDKLLKGQTPVYKKFIKRQRYVITNS